MQLPCRKGPGTHWAPSAALLSAAATCFKLRYSKLDVSPTTTSQILASNFLANNTVVFQAELNAGASLMRAAPVCRPPKLGRARPCVPHEEHKLSPN